MLRGAIKCDEVAETAGAFARHITLFMEFA
jgi:hypothetical protein